MPSDLGSSSLSAPGTATPKRTVSFGPTSSAPSSGAGMTSFSSPDASSGVGTSSSVQASANTSATSTPSALKPALKAGTERRKLPPPEQYQHPDPLIRRLRLVDGNGKPVNLKEHFKGVKLVGFYFSSQWAGQPLKEYHKTISHFCAEHPREFKIVYVSVDVDEQWYKAGVKGQPWVSMVWNDGSSLPSERPDASTTSHSISGPSPSLHNSEDFLLAMEQDIDESLSKTDTSGTAYLRPFSRVHLAAKLNIIAAPTLSVYHLESGRMLDKNVRMARLNGQERDETWGRWMRGEGPKAIGLAEAFQRRPSFFFLLGFAVIYWSFILIGGQDYNFLARIVNNLSGQVSTSLAEKGAASVAPPGL